MGQQPLSLMVRVIKLQWPRLKRSSSKTSVYTFMTSLMQGWQQFSDRGCMVDEVCIWRYAKVLTKRCHFPCSLINLPIPSADGITAYQQLMWEVFCDQYWERVGTHDFCFTDHWQGSSAKFAYQKAKVMTFIPVWDILDIYFWYLCLSLLRPSGLVCKFGGTPLPVICETEVKLMDADALPVLVTKDSPVPTWVADRQWCYQPREWDDYLWNKESDIV